MLTHQIIQSEIEELKQILTHKDLTILILELYLARHSMHVMVFLSSYFSYGISDLSTGLDRIAAMVLLGLWAYFLSLQLRIPDRSSFLYLNLSGKNRYFWFLAKKCKVYGMVVLLYSHAWHFLCIQRN